MAIKNIPNPPELVLLKALWAHGSKPVRRLHDLCVDDLNWSFSSTRKTLERMQSKGFVVLNRPEKGVATYSAKVSKTKLLASMTIDFSGRVLEINGPVPASLFSNSNLLTDDDIEELEGLLGM